MTWWSEPELQRALTESDRRLVDVRALPDTDAYRVIDDETRGLTLDRYGADYVLSLLAETDLTDAGAKEAVLADGRRIGRWLGGRLQARAVYLKVRPRQANTLVSARDAGLTPPQPVFGTAALRDQVVTENGVRIGVHLGEGLGTGIYLDQRDNRRWLRDQAAGKRVLNTFCYTAAFSVAAGVGGAQKTVSIDAAQPALTQARRNFELNGLTDPTQHDLIRGDVLAWLPKLAKRGDRFDIVVLDPPSYAQVDGKRWQAARDYPALLALALAVLGPRGQVLACINHAGVDAGRFKRLLQDGLDQAGRKGRLRVLPTPVDFPSARMKAVRIDVP